MKNKIQMAFLIVALLLAAFGCKKQQDYTQPLLSSSSSPGSNEVWIQNMAFNPSSITVSVNTTIQWTNKDAVTHTATSNNGVFDSGSINDGGVYSYHFTTPGTYAYHCTLHPHMTATIVVH